MNNTDRLSFGLSHTILGETERQGGDKSKKRLSRRLM